MIVYEFGNKVVYCVVEYLVLLAQMLGILCKENLLQRQFQDEENLEAGATSS